MNTKLIKKLLKKSNLNKKQTLAILLYMLSKKLKSDFIFDNFFDYNDRSIVDWSDFLSKEIGTEYATCSCEKGSENCKIIGDLATKILQWDVFTNDEKLEIENITQLPHGDDEPFGDCGVNVSKTYFILLKKYLEN